MYNIIIFIVNKYWIVKVNDSFPPNGWSYAITIRKENEFTKATGPSANWVGLEPMMILLRLLGSTFITDLVMGLNEYASSKGYYIFNYIRI